MGGGMARGRHACIFSIHKASFLMTLAAQKAPRAKRLSGRGRSLALGLYGVYRRRHQHDRLRARAPAAPLRGRDVFRSEKSAPFQSLEPFGSSQSPRARPAPHESLDVFAAPSARGRER